MIKELIEVRVRPEFLAHGGDIVYKGFDAETGVVIVKMMVGSGEVEGSNGGIPRWW